MNIKRHVSLNLNVRGLEVSATLAINEICKEMMKKGKKVYNLGLGQSPFPVPSPVVEALRLHAHEKEYLPVKGLSELREAVAEFHRKKDHVDANADYVLIGPGSKELLFLLQLVFYGEIIVPAPCWVSYIPQAQIIGRKVRIIHTTFEDEWRITPEKFEELCESEHDIYRPRILVLNYPSNPDGGTYPPDDLKKIADVARKFEVILLSDEIYGRLHYKGEHVSVAKFYPEGTIISSGLSKWCGAGGWRLGTFTMPSTLDWLMETMAAVASETYTSVCAPIQYAAITAFRGGVSIERYLWHVRRILSTLGNECCRILSDAGIRVHPPKGAFYLFLDFSPFAEKMKKDGIKDDKSMCMRLLRDVSVAALPGSDFALSPQALTARISFVNFDGAKALAASENIPLHSEIPPDFIEKWCEPTIHAVQRIADWLTKYQ